MLNSGILVLCLLNFGYISLLPRKFFRKGAGLSLHWWATAAPLFISPALIALSYAKVIPLFLDWDDPWLNTLAMLCVFPSTASLIVMGMALGTHRIPIYMFHDKHDKSQSHLVTYGIYQYIRHPIYASYLLALIAAFIFCPQIGTLICMLWGMFSLNHTAAGEETKLSTSEELGSEYVEYIKRSGRFLPPLSAISLHHQATVDEVAAESAPDEGIREVSTASAHQESNPKT